jgi:hypothetical protein
MVFPYKDQITFDLNYLGAPILRTQQQLIDTSDYDALYFSCNIFTTEVVVPPPPLDHYPVYDTDVAIYTSQFSYQNKGNPLFTNNITEYVGVASKVTPSDHTILVQTGITVYGIIPLFSNSILIEYRALAPVAPAVPQTYTFTVSIKLK